MRTRAALVSFLALLPAAPAAAQVEVRATVSEDTIGLDGTVEYRIAVTGAGVREVDVSEPPVPRGLTAFGSSESSEVSIVNGRVERRVVHVLVYRPFRLGTAVVGPATVRVGGERYTAPPATVTVAPGRSVAGAPPRLPPSVLPPLDGEGPGARALPGSSLPAVFVTNRLSRDEVYVGEQVVLTFAFYQSPRAMVLDQPNYASAKTPGFWTQDFNREPEISRELIGGEPYTIQRFHYALFPLTQGLKSIAPATLTLTLRDPVAFLDRGRTHTLAGDTLRLVVKPLPGEGRPEGFSGAVGRYRLEARVEPRELERDAPATLVVTVSGEGNLATVPPPRLPELEGMRVFDPEVETRVTPKGLAVTGEKEFRYLLVPKRAATLGLGVASLPYFDPHAAAYVTATVDLGQLAVARPVGGTEPEPHPPGLALAGIRTGPVGGAGASPWRSPFYWVLAALPLLAPALLLALRRRPLRMARPSHRPLAAAAALRHDPSPAGAARARRELLQHVEARHGAGLAGRSLAAVERELVASGVASDLAERVGQALRALEATEFAPAEARQATIAEAVLALDRVEEAERSGRARGSRRGFPRGTRASR